MSKKILLSSEDFILLKSDLDYLDRKFWHVITTSQHGISSTEANLSTNRSENEKYGFWLNYSGNAVYDFKTNKKLTQRSINHLRELITKIKNASSKLDDPRLDVVLNRLDNFESQIPIKNTSTQAALENQTGRKEDVRLTLLETFANRSYYLYYRFSDAIARQVIVFTRSKKKGELNVAIKGIDAYPALEGTASCNGAANILSITAWHRSTNFGHTHFMLSVNPAANSHELVLGQMMFQHRDNKNIITKSVVLEYPQGNSELATASVTLDEKITSTIDEKIVKFLYDKNQNKFASPDNAAVTSHQTLKIWQDRKALALKRQRINKILGTYILYFNGAPSAKTVVLNKSQLVISENPLSQKIEASYEYHYNEESFDFWVGEPIMNIETRVLSIVFNGPYDQPTQQEQNVITNKPIFLMLNIPFAEVVQDTFAGIITGHRDTGEGIVSRLVVAVREEHAPKTEKYLNDFFYSYSERSWTRPPSKGKIMTHKDIESSAILQEGLLSKDEFNKQYMAHKKHDSQ